MAHPFSLKVRRNSVLITFLTALAACAPMTPLPVAADGKPQVLQKTNSALECTVLSGPRMSARLVAANSATGLPEHCQVLGAIPASSLGADPIRFQINLPSTWNRKALMVGGGGFNGSLTDGLAPLRDAAAGQAHPLTQGYVTFGTDSGHDAKEYGATEPAKFALNDEMLRNFAYASYKSVKDVAHTVIQSYYQATPSKQYFYGGSEGGREGLMMAQRYPNDFDGIVSVVPVIYWTGLFNGFIDASRPQYEGGALSAAKIRFVADAVNASCDALDGLADGLVNHYAGCNATFNIKSLRCESGKDLGEHCLSDHQMRTLEAIYQPATLPFPLANGVNRYPARFWGGEIQTGGEGLARWLSNGKAPTTPISRQDSRIVNYGSSYARYVIARDGQFDVRQYDPLRFQTRIVEVSHLMDASNPDLSAFFNRGGKLIIRENTGDIAQSAAAGMQYFETVQKTVGQRMSEQSMRLYVASPAAHSGQASSLTTGIEAATNHDLLSTLDHWVTESVVPADSLKLVRNASTAPFALQASRPMCRYPMYAHYVGGDMTEFGSYRCQRSQ